MRDLVVQSSYGLFLQKRFKEWKTCLLDPNFRLVKVKKKEYFWHQPFKQKLDCIKKNRKIIGPKLCKNRLHVGEFLGFTISFYFARE